MSKLGGSFFWIKRAADADPITDIKVLYGEEVTPDGYQKIGEDIAKSNDKAKSVFLAFTKSKDKGSAYLDLKIIGGEENVGEGYDRIETELNKFLAEKTKDKLYLCVKSLKAAKEPGSTLPTGLQKGDFVDVKDSRDKWCIAEAVQVDEAKKEVLVHYVGWSDRWNEWIKLTDPKKIAK
jgi:hypothetical protein